MTDEELSRLLDEYRDAVTDRIEVPTERGRHERERHARHAIHAYFERRKSGEGAWRPIETAPDDGSEIVVAYDDGTVEVIEADQKRKPYKPPKQYIGLKVSAPILWTPIPHDAIDAARTEGKGDG